MMRLVMATFVKNEVEPGWPILSESVPLGQRYVVDLDDVTRMPLMNRATGQTVVLDWIYVVAPGNPPGYLPLLAFRIEADA